MLWSMVMKVLTCFFLCYFCFLGSSHAMIDFFVDANKALSGKWCLKDKNLNYNHEFTLASNGRITSKVLFKDSSKVFETYGGWLVDGNNLNFLHSENPQYDVFTLYKLIKGDDGKTVLEIDFQDGLPAKHYELCIYI